MERGVLSVALKRSPFLSSLAQALIAFRCPPSADSACMHIERRLQHVPFGLRRIAVYRAHQFTGLARTASKLTALQRRAERFRVRVRPCRS